MLTKITHVMVFVHNQDEALSFYKKIGFTVHTDAPFGDLRWLTLTMPEQKDVEVALIKAETAQEKALVGKQADLKPIFSLESTDIYADYKKLSQEGINFVQEPVEEPWGTSMGFKDIYGNMIYVCQPK